MNYYHRVITLRSPVNPRVVYLFGMVILMLVLPITGFGQTPISRGSDTLADLVFEQPRVLVDANVRFPELRHIGNRLFLFYQRLETRGQDSQITIEIIESQDQGRTWSSASRIGEAVQYSGSNPPPIYSVPDNGRDGLKIAIADQATSISLYDVESRQRLAVIQSPQTIVSPRLYSLNSQGYILFAVQNVSGRLTLLSTRSTDGTDWNPFQVFSEDQSILFSFNPVLHYDEGLDRILVVFQGLKLSESSYYQLFSRYSDNGGRSWSVTRRVTLQPDVFDDTDPNLYDNQRPDLAEVGNQLYMVWERKTSGLNPQVAIAGLSAQGDVLGDIEPVTTRSQGASDPQILDLGGVPGVLYYDNPLGISRIFLAARDRQSWVARNLSPGDGTSTFAASTQVDSRLYLVWQNRRSQADGVARLVYREPDQSAPLPRLVPQNFTLGVRSNRERVQVRVEPRPDVSGITHFAYAWARTPEEARSQLEGAEAIPLEDGGLDLLATDDGEWVLGVRVRDSIGNWSDQNTITYFRDRTPPKQVVIEYPPLDESGYLSSNTFTLKWQENDEIDLAGYAVAFRYLGPARTAIPPSAPAVPARFGTSIQRATTISRENIDNGLWALTVSAVDQVGNVGPPSTLFVRLNKYIPVTILRNAALEQDILGHFELELIGRGFNTNGVIDTIILDQDGQEPWDYEFAANRDEYQIESDTRISGIRISDVVTGSYRMILNHTERGSYRGSQSIQLKAAGTILFGNYTLYKPYSSLEPVTGVMTLTSRDALFWLTMVLLTGVLGVTLIRIRGVIVETRVLSAEAHAILAGKPRTLPAERERIRRMKKRGISLRIKFSVLIIILVFSVVMLIALPLRSFVLTNQQRTLAEGLEQRVQVLIESIASGAANLMPTASANTIELANLILQSTVMDEAQFVTITDQNEIVWATNDPYLTGETLPPQTGEASTDFENSAYFQRTLQGDEYLPGQHPVEDQLSQSIADLENRINTQARDELGELPEELDRLGDEIRSLVLSTSTDAARRRAEIDSIRRGLSQRIDETLKSIGGDVQSAPAFSPGAYNPDQQYYLFYKPVMYRVSGQSGAEAEYYQGMVRMGVSTQIINQRILETQQLIQQNILIFSLIALAVGIAGAGLLSFITVNPIKKLVAGVELIRDTEDKSELKNFGISMNTRDELNTLAVVIQQMAQGLAKAAETNKELLFGKDVQKMFIQLDTGPNNNKLSTGHTQSDFSDFFGYYEGAKGVSGDYFYYQKITQDTYAIIKCDISGKGISAALIMVEVATLFLNYFSDWEQKQKVLKKRGGRREPLSTLVYNINDLVAERQFTGRFAALNIVLFNERTGAITYCNAGDNQVFSYRRSKGEVVQSSLFASPAAGVFNSKDIPVQFKEEYDQLEPGDELMLFTDGLEEAKRHFRNTDGTLKQVTQEDIDEGNLPEDIIPNTNSEEFGLTRLTALINTVKQGGVFHLTKYFAPYEPGDIVFDFRELEDTTENTVLSIIAVEKMFRLNPDPSAGPDDRVSIDKKVDDFLRIYCRDYSKYFSYQLEEDPNSLYRVYTHLKEDEQYDDLTILTVKKK